MAEPQEVGTHEIVTPLTKTKVVLKDYITGFDDEAIQKIYMRGASRIEVKDKAAGTGSADYDGNVIIEADHEGLKRVVVSVNGSAENIVEAILGLPLKDSKFVQQEVGYILNPLAEASKDAPSKA